MDPTGLGVVADDREEPPQVRRLSGVSVPVPTWVTAPWHEIDSYPSPFS